MIAANTHSTHSVAGSWLQTYRYGLFAVLVLAALLASSCQKQDWLEPDPQVSTGEQEVETSFSDTQSSESTGEAEPTSDSPREAERTNESTVETEPTSESTGGTHFANNASAVQSVFNSYEVDSQAVSAGFHCLDDSATRYQTKRFAFEGTCGRPNENDCAYFNYRNLNLAGAGFDQRGIDSYQVTFPGQDHLWAALSIKNPPGSRFCWVGGAHIGRNPLAMTWNGAVGTKKRKNNFLLTEDGLIQVEGVRLHNMHDAFLAKGSDAGFEIRDSWVSWTRDDFFEGYLYNLGIHDSLIDGTYTFISSPDGDCGQSMNAADRTVVIENSLIRLQRMPGPYSRESQRWHGQVAGGHNLLWKLDGCSWDEWPEFVLKNNVFLIEGPRTTSDQLNSVECNLALPGDCLDPSLGKLRECENNLFLYSEYGDWLDGQKLPGPAPILGGQFHNANNPDYLPNGADCYQRLTDDPRDAGYADVETIWKKFRKQWIEKHTNSAAGSNNPRRIPGVDFPVFSDGSVITLYNAKSEDCLTSTDGGEVLLQSCDSSPEQQFEVQSFSDGKLMASVLLKDSAGRYMRSSIPNTESSDSGPASRVVMESSKNGRPDFEERWYILPLDEISDGRQRVYSIETDVIRRSFLRDESGEPVIQGLYSAGRDTPLPQPRFLNGKDTALHWLVIERSTKDM